MHAQELLQKKYWKYKVYELVHLKMQNENRTRIIKIRLSFFSYTHEHRVQPELQVFLQNFDHRKEQVNRQQARKRDHHHGPYCFKSPLPSVPVILDFFIPIYAVLFSSR
jgi:hypothetical protein